MSDELNTLRARIDRTDAEIVALLNARAKLAQQVGELKAKTDAPVYRPEREAAVIERAQANSEGPLSNAALAAIYREIIGSCRDLERRLRIAYLGPAGTFSEQAALAHFGSLIDLQPQPSFDAVFRAAAADAADFGVVGIENSTEGAVNRSLDLLLTTDLTICGEISLPIRHCLLARQPQLSGVSRVCAHAQALAQCHGYLSTHHPLLEREAVSSNGEAARLASTDAGIAAIAGEAAAERYGLTVVARNIQDDPSNRTRFVVVGRHRCAPSGNDMTSLILSVPDRAGAVHALIEPLARHGISMKRFESRPARQGGWEYYFYIDILGHQDDPKVAVALNELRANAAFYKVLGSYPRA